ncbi:4-hydroxybenzoyl-CoA thioesterase [Chromobacterium violaceum]|uniref:acyl-CoA thioesterase n=1 Tax=Chromobacterium violaceum TaxID=536 RepID=UPI000653F886|nr:acyl-CoA thioesterase [Chromobacterium violaceum]KMN49131.1 4-hydroxybenzoyl-CoA thioesterase [Chromobacterium violaceum]KMN84805.1 4-hydroxybenzoyl-CoA thioesterase [Chromobacterium violaceum]KMN88262.1 4-hydroxybenzoyl-CoA thioesterase [Chromobacterium violaceum]KMO02202.1 4-hydroxybenzoyl-CoA thioesterase [Chromobacterium violaceum]QIY81737.1 acyl-CoA thioesterase [Chromobacterium violaceum]
MTKLSHVIELEPAFHDLDPMDVVWHGNYVKYLEIARCALLERFDYNYPQMRDSGYAWPIVDMRLKYVQPVRFGQKVTIEASIVEWESRLKIDYLIRDAASGRKINKAYTVQVAVDMASQEMLYVCPPVLWEKLGVPAP